MIQRQSAARRGRESAQLRRVRAARRRRRRRRTFFAILAAALIVLIALGAWALFGRDRVDLSRYPMTYAPEIRAAAQEFSLDPAYVASVVLAESSFDAEAVSSVGAIGLMQIMPATGEWIAGKLDDVFDVERLYEPSVNLRYGCWYLIDIRIETVTMAICTPPPPPTIRGRAAWISGWKTRNTVRTAGRSRRSLPPSPILM